MNTTTNWILVVGAVVLVGIGVILGLGVLRGGEERAPAQQGATAVARTPDARDADPAPVGEPTEAASPGEQAARTAPLDPQRDPAPTLPGAAAGESPAPTGATAGQTANPGPVTVTVSELVAGGASHEGREVVLTGRILTLCVRGCQFSLDDGTGVIHVELVDEALDRVVPRQGITRRIEVSGVFRRSPRPHVSVERPDGWRFP